MATHMESGVVLPVAEARFAGHVPVAIIGAGACGLVAALAAQEAGATATIYERDTSPRGSTALSSGFIPAANTRWQAEKGIDDTPDRLSADIMEKNKSEADLLIVDTVCRAAGPALEWLADRHGIPFELLDSFLYPGHSRHRMHATPGKTGADLMQYLLAAAGRAEIEIETGARTKALFLDGETIAGIRIDRPGDVLDDIKCGALVLACNGYGGNPELVRRHTPEIAEAVYIGHEGNQGDALRWGAALGADLLDLDAYQAHGAVTQGRNIMITWALMTEGGILLNAEGRRFSNEHEGVSEQAVRVLAQPGGAAWCVLDERLHALGMTFEKYRGAFEGGEIVKADTATALAGVTGLPEGVLFETLNQVSEFARGGASDPLGRDFTAKPPLEPPYRAVKVTGALFHSQGGLAIATDGRVLGRGGAAFSNLFAGGGAARGISGSGPGGYLPGNGLLTAVTLGRICGASAAKHITGEPA